MAPEGPDPAASIGSPGAGEMVGRVPLGQLGWSFIKVGATAFGGLGATIAPIEREFVDGRDALSAADLAEALAAIRLLPGPTVVQLASHVGYRLGGWPGSVVSTVAYLLPSVLAMLGLAVAYGPASAIPAAGPAFGGLAAAVVGLMLATGFRIARSSVRAP